MDINEQTEYSFTIPYMQDANWTSIDPTTILQSTVGDNRRIFSNGIIQLQMINSLTGGSASFNSIYYQVFVMAGEDLQFAGPDLAGLVNRGTFLFPAPPPLDSDDDFVTQMDEKTECEFPSSSMNCLRDTVYPVIGGISTGYKMHRVQTSYEVTSIRQLCNMISPLQKVNEPITPDENYYGMSWSPGGVILASQTNQWSRNYLLQMMQVFRYYRGGTRIVSMSNDNLTDVGAYIVHSNGTTDAVQVYNDNVFADTFDLSLTSQGFAWFPHVEFNTCDVIAPYLSKYNCRLIQYSPNAQVQTTENDQSRIYIGAKPVSALTDWTTIFGMGAADDFLLGFQLGIPLSIWVSP